MATISKSAVALRFSAGSFGSSSKPLEFHPLQCGPANVSFRGKEKVGMRKPLTVQATYRQSDPLDSAGMFVGGFILGGLIIGALGCVYAPQISKAVVGEKRQLLKKLPKFMYDEEKDLENTRKVLMDKIGQLNAELDSVTFKLQKLEYI
ncbi:hypothetical protein FCM35_KLT10183 [Carex littledalei]|uniref:Uncharacterized protein n=1 Tax=Carex littledalei TaxID=544730 RepID=A0A833W2V0_9POAL|nr:hypothetical protein FCM35_KLT10183 [Carex littledalei]